MGCLCFSKENPLQELPKPIKKHHLKVIKEIKKNNTFKSNFNLYEKQSNFGV
jgi:hypothetical protein